MLPKLARKRRRQFAYHECRSCRQAVTLPEMRDRVLGRAARPLDRVPMRWLKRGIDTAVHTP